MEGEGAEGPSSTTDTKEEEAGSLVEEARALISTSETTPEHTAGGPPSSTETQAEEEGASLLEGVAVPSDTSETAPQCTAGDSSEKSRKRVRPFVGAEEQG